MTNASTVVTSLRGLETRTLRSSVSQSKNEDSGASLDESKHTGTNSLDEDDALAHEEEKLMLEDGDEEISSHDEAGNPIVDTDKLEKRMLTVAIVNSVVETSGGETQPHRYGLRKRRRPSGKDTGSPRSVEGGGRAHRSNGSGSPRSPREGGPVTRSSPAPSPRTTRSSVTVKEEEVKKDEEAATLTPPSEPAAPALKAESPVSEPVVAKVKTEVKVEEPSAINCTNVPNPLANSTPSPVEPKPLVAMAIKKENDDKQGTSEAATAGNGPHTSLAPAVGNAQLQTGTVNTALPSAPAAVACPLPPPSSKDNAKPGQAAPTSSAAMDARARRGRIFSIDIDPAGLDFPDLGIVDTMNQQSELSRAAPLPPISATVSGGAQPAASNSHVSQQQVPQDKTVGFSAEPPKHPAEANGDLLIVGRDRAMSFEFFSFGLNHDEPLPPAPNLSAAAVENLSRPRGDSIIFDPCSFRDGGILEENGLLKSRGNSIDITMNEEVAIMNEPGFAPAPNTLSHVENHTQSNTQIHAPRPDHATSISVGGNATYLLPTRTGSSQLTTSVLHTQPTLTKSSSSAQMATLPSSLSGSSMSHSTFQMELLNKDGRIGIYLPEARKERIAKFHSKRKMRIWRKRIKYDCRKKLADSRPRIKGRFVKRSDMEEDED